MMLMKLLFGRKLGRKPYVKSETHISISNYDVNKLSQLCAFYEVTPVELIRDSLFRLDIEMKRTLSL